MRKTRNNFWLRLAVLGLYIFCLGSASFASAELILSAPPRENPSVGEKLYGPLAAHLTELLGEEVVYRHPQNWLQYQRDVRKGVYDIVFDGPHFVSWRLEHLKHDVLVKLPGSLEFVVVIHDDNDEIKSMKDLIGKKVCAIPPPNLATLTLIEQFNNPVRQPIIWGTSGGFMSVFQSFAAKQCVAAVLRARFYDKLLTKQDRAGIKVLFRSKPLPNQAISAGPKINSDSKQKIIRSLTLGKGQIAIQSISKRFAGNQAFIKAQNEEYLSHNFLLEGVVFGW